MTKNEGECDRCSLPKRTRIQQLAKPLERAKTYTESFLFSLTLILSQKMAPIRLFIILLLLPTFTCGWGEHNDTASMDWGRSSWAASQHNPWRGGGRMKVSSCLTYSRVCVFF